MTAKDWADDISNTVRVRALDIYSDEGNNGWGISRPGAKRKAMVEVIENALTCVAELKHPFIEKYGVDLNEAEAIACLAGISLYQLREANA